MRMSDLIAQYIINMLEEDDSDDPSATIKRNELAQSIGCVPSQINYVITSRFTPEQGYVVESRRGGGGYIKITRISMDKHTAVLHMMEGIGDTLDETTAAAIVGELLSRGLIDVHTAQIICAATAQQPYQSLPPEQRDKLRAAIFKSILLAVS
ncbi:MAG: CtsR family transcriptional regulator [Clostridia bacterium]|nr:CtsR family transcriptional regulator [Clostridia bacterium]